MVEEAVLLLHMVRQEAQRGDHARADVVRRQIAALVADAHGGQPEAGGGDAGGAAMIGTAIGQRAIAHQAAATAGFVPEKQECAADNFFQQLFVGEG